MKNVWTDERIELLRKLWNEGLSTSKIAAQLGGVTRNSVIGKAHRIGLSARAVARPRHSYPTASGRIPKLATKPRNPMNNNPLGFHGKQRPSSPPPHPYKPAVVEDIVVPISLKVSLLALTAAMCKWPEGDPGTPGFAFCGHRSWNSLPYCEYHSRIAYQPHNDKRARLA